MKVYVKEKEEKDSDGNPLQVVQVETSKIESFSYLVFIKK